MPFNISFFNTPKHRVFHYEPRYYDERKEHREMVRQEALKEKAIREGREWKDESYKPGKFISGRLQEQARNGRRHALNERIIKIAGLASLAVFILFLIKFAQGFRIFLESMH